MKKKTIVVVGNGNTSSSSTSMHQSSSWDNSGRTTIENITSSSNSSSNVFDDSNAANNANNRNNNNNNDDCSSGGGDNDSSSRSIISDLSGSALSSSSTTTTTLSSLNTSSSLMIRSGSESRKRSRSISRRRKSSIAVLEELTINKLRFNEVGIYGRQDQLKTIEDCIKRLITAASAASTLSPASSTAKKKELIWISGYSGSGKTTMAKSLFKKTKKKKHSALKGNFVFVEGKFDMLTIQSSPLSGIVSICRQLCLEVEKHNNNKIKSKVRKQLIDQLGQEQLELFQSFLPELRTLLILEDNNDFEDDDDHHHLGDKEDNGNDNDNDNDNSMLKEEEDEEDLSSNSRKIPPPNDKNERPLLDVATPNNEATEKAILLANKNNMTTTTATSTKHNMTTTTTTTTSSSRSSTEATNQQIKYCFRVFLSVSTTNLSSSLSECCYCCRRNPENNGHHDHDQTLSKAAVVVLLLDDLQWASSEALDLLKDFLLDQDNNNKMEEEQTQTQTQTQRVLVLGCYRSDEVETELTTTNDDDVEKNSTGSSSSSSSSSPQQTQTQQQKQHPLSNLISELKDIKNGTLNITSLEVGNLSVDDCNKILMDLLSIDDDPTKTIDLATLCHQRTFGNAYFFIQFIVMLNEYSLLEYNLGLLKWNWNLSEITQQTSASPNVVALVKERIENTKATDVSLRHFLKVLSCLGPVPSLRVINLAWNSKYQQQQQQHKAPSLPTRTNGGNGDVKDDGNNNDSNEETIKNGIASKEEDEDNNNNNNNNSYRYDGDNDNDDENIENAATTTSIPVDEMIEDAIEANYIERSGGGSDTGDVSPSSNDHHFRFVHDKILEASISLMTEQERNQLRYTIGMQLLNGLDKNEIESELFLITDLINCPADDIATTSYVDGNDNSSSRNNNTNLAAPEQRQIISDHNDLMIDMNLRAAEKAKSLSSFSSSLKYAMTGTSLLPSSSQGEEFCWKSKYDTALRLYSVGAETAGSIGEVDTLDEICKAVLDRNDIPIFDKLRIYNALLDSMASNGKLVDAQNLVCDLLNKLGCKVPGRGLIPALRTLWSISALNKKPPSKGDIEILPKMTDRYQSESLRLLYQLQTFSYLNREVPLFLWSCTKQVQLTMKYGIHELSAAAFPAMGAIMVAIFTDFQTGTLFARNGRLILDLWGHKIAEARVAFGCVIAPSYYQPMQSLIKGLSRSAKIGMQVGDTDSAMWCLAHGCWLQFMTGKPLQEVEADCRVSVNRMKLLNRKEAVHFTCPVWQATLNLMGLSRFKTILAGEAFGTDDDKEVWNIAEAGPLRPHLEICKTALKTYFGDYVSGAELFIKRGDRYLNDHPGHPQGNMDSFLKGVCLFAAAQQSKKRKYRKHAYKARAVIASWWKKGNPNSQHQLSFLDAEHYSLNGKWEDAIVEYQKTITLASRYGLIQDAALVNERYAACLLKRGKQGDVEEAYFRLQQSMQLFREWGALAVVENLQERYGETISRYR